MDTVAVIACLANIHIVWRNLSRFSLLSRFVHEVKRLKLCSEFRVLTVLFLETFQEKPKHKVRQWSFGKSSSVDEKVLIKKGENEYPTPWSSNKGTPVRNSNTHFSMSMYTSQVEWAAVRIQTAFRGYLV